MPALIAFLLALTATCSAPRPAVAKVPTDALAPVFIAHAGGVARQRVYTNSREALDDSIDRGFHLAELDFSWTTDDELVLIHDWDVNVEELFELPREPVSAATFRRAVSPWGLTHLDLERLEPWLREHEGMDVITDVKGRNVEALALIAARAPDLLDRFVPQIYEPDEYEPVRALGFERIMLTLYVSNLPDEDVLAFADEHELFGVAMPIPRGRSELPGRLATMGLPVYVHTVNDYTSLEELQANGVHGVYTDWLSPADAAVVRRRRELAPWAESRDELATLPVRVAPVLPPKEAGFTAGLELVNGGAVDRRVALATFEVDGAEREAHTVPLAPGASETVDLHALFDGPVQGWLRVGANDDVALTPRWGFGQGPDLPWVVTDRSWRRYTVRGPGADVRGHMVALVNPTTTVQSYRLERRVGGELVDRLDREVAPGAQWVRIFGCLTDEIVEVTVSGGPMVTQALRWDAYRGVMR